MIAIQALMFNLALMGGDSNLYGYVLNDPVNLIDVLGLSALSKKQCKKLNHLNQTIIHLNPPN